MSGVEKLFAGYGKLNDSLNNPGNDRRCVSTAGNTVYATGNGGEVPPLTDYLPSNAVATFNSQITTFNYPTIAPYYQNYLTVVGPIPGNNPSGTNPSDTSTAAKGVCQGDSGGPVFIPKTNPGTGPKWIVAALTQGTNNILSPQPNGTTPPFNSFNGSVAAGCAYGYGVFTTVGNHIDWVQTSSGVDFTSVVNN
jgi:hypothetical protein